MKKKFDAVQMVRQIRDKIYRETKGMSQEEYLAYIRKGSKKLHDELGQRKPRKHFIKN